MAKKRKLPTPPDELSVETILWDDHAEITRGTWSTDIAQWHTTGVVIYEDDRQVHLASYVDPENNFYESDELTYAQILKPLIVSRQVIGKIKWPPVAPSTHPSE